MLIEALGMGVIGTRRRQGSSQFVYGGRLRRGFVRGFGDGAEGRAGGGISRLSIAIAIAARIAIGIRIAVTSPIQIWTATATATPTAAGQRNFVRRLLVEGGVAGAGASMLMGGGAGRVVVIVRLLLLLLRPIHRWREDVAAGHSHGHGKAGAKRSETRQDETRGSSARSNEQQDFGGDVARVYRVKRRSGDGWRECRGPKRRDER
jgi:hypothetical protein